MDLGELAIGLPGGLAVKNPSANSGDTGQSLGWEDPLEEGMATHSSILAWRLPWTEEPDGLQSMGSQRVRQDLAIEHMHEAGYFWAFPGLMYSKDIQIQGQILPFALALD